MEYSRGIMTAFKKTPHDALENVSQILLVDISNANRHTRFNRHRLEASDSSGSPCL
ncbi:hypothetical protein [Marinomonas hwangdonensis]|uniref:hypothetical protein n=1 Tax=Marinomonas hwangdonensis TaxID=1053647 RepID=UPI0013149EEB|nr:hypothetical protein [Marinomonas hwangdonensis]